MTASHLQVPSCCSCVLSFFFTSLFPFISLTHSVIYFSRIVFIYGIIQSYFSFENNDKGFLDELQTEKLDHLRLNKPVFNRNA